MPNISKIKIPNGTECSLKDVTAVDSFIYNTTSTPVFTYTINGSTPATVVETPDTTPTEGSKHLITSGAVYTTLNTINSTLESLL